MIPSARTAALLAVLQLALPAARAEDVGLDLAGRDLAVAPGDDFFLHANGTWLKETEIPADRAVMTMGAVVAERTARQVAEIIKEAAASPGPAGSDRRRIADFYATFMDEAGIEARGLAPLQPTLDRIARISDRRALAAYLGGTLRTDVDVLNATNLYTDNLFGLWIAADFDQPQRYLPFLLQGGLDMPDRAYYLDASPRMTEARAKFQGHVANVLGLLKAEDAAARAAAVAELEKKMAEVHWTRGDSDSAQKGNNHWTRADFDRKAPGLDWAAFFEAAGLGRQQDFVAWQPSAIAGLSALTKSEPLEVWKDYLRFHAAEHHAAVLPDAFGLERFAFHGTALLGTPRRRERERRAIDATSGSLAVPVGRLYVEKHFPPAAKARAQEMVENIKAAFGRRIDDLAWMSPATRARAKEKLGVLRVGVGYPDRWPDTAGLEIVKGDAFGNADRVELFGYRRDLARLGTPVDRAEWVMSPQIVNAVNLPVLNAMNFPAAILQPPYFDPSRPLAMDYGAIGTVMGHEISHSFDDQGALFDAQGRLRDWWTPEDRKHFMEQAEKLVAQYDAYRPFPDLPVNGRLTLGENIADVAGLAAAYDAYRASLGGREAPAAAGLSGDQQFFLAFAQNWRAKMREQTARQLLVADGHAPHRYRADTVRNNDAWYAAFAVKPGQQLYLKPEERVRMW